jgi:putative DNA primase/helicase
MSGIFNWLIEGYRLLQADGLTIPKKINDAIDAYRQEADIIGSFLCECTALQEGSRTTAQPNIRRLYPLG